ncbi:NADH-quinone oxidoreductase subunit B family protein [Hydrogenophilus thermoluteolus]|uniref:hydrogenase (acceptor) n=1 Tax=Hydrogenophilus thermoluteolus TaxID=297 RepID=A0A2Z6DZA2_HYDTE|nr:hypothetical protein [Hydrogenophilus thermoluteolus]MBW7656016.1 hypothetical protein [Hydrogenophilus thermoluteolus]BBD77680.1 uptake hydrogenase small subunit [Hydrogenophilus thermoluteolus]GLW59935.1 hydrogenase small subunit [Hydrogenophilus thermoluteolus]HNQ48969.1 hypothetical protein [Hydrogenophilus thermoluteolus]HNU19024.1 hypothetical protein [Hydrogenophilus thermoluteolus]
MADDPNGDTALPRLRVLWLQSAGCGGCSQSLLCWEPDDCFSVLESGGIDWVWHPAFSFEGGDTVLERLEACANGDEPFDVLCVEGAMLLGPNGSGAFHRLGGTHSCAEWVKRLAKHARWVIAVGSCAAWGGFGAAMHDTLWQSCGLQFTEKQRGGLLGKQYRSREGWPVINVAGCPIHPAWLVEWLIALADGVVTVDDLDPWGRPLFYAQHLVHHGCPRNEYYEFKASAETLGQLGCMMEHLGCKGTQAHADCNQRPWNGNGSCLKGGYPCIACTEPGFEAPGHPFQETPKVAGIPVGLPTDMPKAWFVALAALSKSATPKRVRRNALSDRVVELPGQRGKEPKP